MEVYQDGVGWLLLALTPGLEDLSAEQTESGIKPVGAGKEGTGDGPHVTEGQELEQDDAEPDNSEDNTPDGGQRTALLHKTLTNEERTSMEQFHVSVLELLKTHINWPKKLRLKWLNCLY